MELDPGVEGSKRLSSWEGINDEFRWADTSIDDTETFWFRRSGASTPVR
jgi:hypothetical protein